MLPRVLQINIPTKMKITVQIGQTLTRRFICGRDLHTRRAGPGGPHITRDQSSVALRAMASADNGSEASGQQFRLFHPHIHGSRSKEQQPLTFAFGFWSAFFVSANSRRSRRPAKGRAVRTKDLSVGVQQLPRKTTDSRTHRGAKTRARRAQKAFAREIPLTSS
jgi:hypothetical protein